MKFPGTRLRRLRKSSALRRLVCETKLSADNLIYPVFAVPGKNRKEDISSMPGISRLSIDLLKNEAKEAWELGIPAIIVFGVPDRKSVSAKGAYDPAGVVQEAIKAVRSACPEMAVATDVCLCGYTESGHCGILKGKEVDNDMSLEALVKTAVSHAKAGADMVAPSAMMDGQVAAIRNALDKEGLKDTAIMAYSAKYASSFYGPFRDAACSAPSFGDRKSYQMDPANSDEAMREIALDIKEGADIVMVKPALAYLDIIRRAKQEFSLPLAAYNVSGEYSMIKAGAEKGLIDGERAMMETLTAIKRAGADIIITYFAKEAAKTLKQGRV